MRDIATFANLMADETRVSAVEREKIDHEVRSIGKVIEAREKKGFCKGSLRD